MPEPHTRDALALPQVRQQQLQSTGAGASGMFAACATARTTLHHAPFPLSKVSTWSNATFVNEQSPFSHKTINGAMSSLDINTTLKFKHVISSRILQGALIIWGKLSRGLPGGFKCHPWMRRARGRVTGDDQSQKGNNWKLKKIWKRISSHKRLRIKPKHSYSQQHTVSQGTIKAWCYYFQGMPLKFCLQT